MVFLLLVSVLISKTPYPNYSGGRYVDGEKLMWRQLAHNQLISLQGPHFSPHSAAKTNDKSTNLRNNDI